MNHAITVTAENKEGDVWQKSTFVADVSLAYKVCNTDLITHRPQPVSETISDADIKETENQNEANGHKYMNICL